MLFCCRKKYFAYSEDKHVHQPIYTKPLKKFVKHFDFTGDQKDLVSAKDFNDYISKVFIKNLSITNMKKIIQRYCVIIKKGNVEYYSGLKIRHYFDH